MTNYYDALNQSESNSNSEDLIEDYNLLEKDSQSLIIEESDSFGLPSTGLSNEEFSMKVMPKQADEFTCSKCFLVHHLSRLANEQNEFMICTDCIA